MENNKVKAIAIDGPSGAGKSTVAKAISKELGFQYIDTGAMYRALTVKALRENLDVYDEEAISNMAKASTVLLKDEANITRVFLDGDDVTEAIRQPDVTANVSVVCSYETVREAMVEQQREMAKAGSVVMDGRDIGSYVLQNALLKIYLTANLEVRGHRRFLEWQKKGITMTEQEVCDDLAKRDHLDSTRKIHPLVCAEDAVYLDSSKLNIDETVQTIIDLWKGKDI